MKKFNEKAFDKFLIEKNVVGFFEKPITLKSGRISNWYVNCRDLQENFGALEKLSDFVLSYVSLNAIEYDYFYAVPDGVTKLGVVLNYKKGRLDKNEKMPIVIGRKTPKEHGSPKDKYFIGPVNEGDRVIIVEDVTTTGGSLIESIGQLKEANVKIVAAIGLVNRMEKRDDGKSVKDAIEDMGIQYYNLCEATRILPKVAKLKKISGETKRMVKEYFETYGTTKLNF